MDNLSIFITKIYKNISKQELTTLPSMIILTGCNGAGKTTFLEAVHSSISPQGSHTTVTVNDCKVEKILFLSLADFVGRRGYGESNPLGAEITNLYEDMALALRLIKPDARTQGNPYHETLKTQVMKWFPVIEATANYLKKDVKALTLQELNDNASWVMAQGKYTNDFFQTNLADIFLGYHNLKDGNEIKLLRKQLRGEHLECYETEADFIKHCGPAPWALINDALKEAGLNYQITFPDSKGTLEEFTPQLIDSSTHREIKYSDLSSGEKTLLKIALSIFNSKQKENFPQMLLLDEIDASLHPEMIVRLLKILTTVFVEKYDIKIILTTHSPTTVAVSREEYIYSIENGNIVKTNKEETLKKLLQGVPTMGILYENIKQVFVESKYDAKFYSILSHALKLQQETNSLLNFISSGSGGSGSAEQTKEIVKSLAIEGNVPSVYGLIDWDSNNSSTEKIFVLGENSRYSRENYTFDPLYLGLLRIRDKLFSPNDETWFKELKIADILGANNDLLQSIYDYTYKLNFYSLSNGKSQSTNLVNGYTILCNAKILNMNGHDLASHVLSSNKVLGKYQEKSEKYENDIYEKVFKEFTSFVYKDMYDILHKVHSIPVQG